MGTDFNAAVNRCQKCLQRSKLFPVLIETFRILAAVHYCKLCLQEQTGNFAMKINLGEVLSSSIKSFLLKLLIV